MSGGGSNPQPQEEQATYNRVLPDPRQYNQIIPNHAGLLADQLSKGGYGSQDQLMRGILATYEQNPNRYDWWHSIIKDGEGYKKKSSTDTKKKAEEDDD